MLTLAPTLPAALRLAEDAAPTASTAQLVIAAVIGIAVIVVLIVWAKMHPFLALVLGTAALALVAGTPLLDTFASFTAGLGSTVGGVGVLIALGAIVGKLLIDSGGADQIVETILAKTPARRVPWALALIAFIVSIPLFFEVGVVLLIPVVMLVARRARVSPVLVGIPALAGLSALHGLVPPHPGPLIAIEALGANLGLRLGLGLLVAIPTVIVSGPVLARILVRYVHLPPPTTVLGVSDDDADDRTARRPGFSVSMGVVLLPVVLMLARAVVEIAGQEESRWGSVLAFFGEPLVALLLTSLVALFVFGTAVGRSRSQLSDLVASSFLPIAGILLIVGAGGGFKQTLVDSGVGDVIAQGITAANVMLPALTDGASGSR